MFSRTLLYERSDGRKEKAPLFAIPRARARRTANLECRNAFCCQPPFLIEHCRGMLATVFEIVLADFKSWFRSPWRESWYPSTLRSNRTDAQVSRNVSMIRPLVTLCLLLLYCWPLRAQNEAITKRDPNNLILLLLNTMPLGGGYSATSGATRDLQSAVQVSGGRLYVKPSVARATYCSGATYLVFLQAIQALLPDSLIGERLAEALAIKGQPDGVGVWGRWNANGPGTACLFSELRLGHNFTSFDEAKPGDFMKIFWTDAVGTREHGHSVIYLGRAPVNGVDTVRFWSSNKPAGYGEKAVPRSRISHAIFSRLETPSNIEGSVTLSRKNGYLSGLVTRQSSISEALDQSGTMRQ